MSGAKSQRKESLQRDSVQTRSPEEEDRKYRIVDSLQIF